MSNNKKNYNIVEIFALGVEKLNKKEFKLALDIFKIIKIDPNLENIHYDLGNLYLASGDLQKSVNCFKKAIKINPNTIKPYVNLAICETWLGNLQKAKKIYEKLLNKDKPYKEVFIGYGRLLLKLNKHKEGLNYIKLGEGIIRFKDLNLEIKG